MEEFLTLSEGDYQNCFTFYPNIMSLIDFKYIPGAEPDDAGNFEYKKPEVETLITNIKALAEKLGPAHVVKVQARAAPARAERVAAKRELEKKALKAKVQATAAEQGVSVPKVKVTGQGAREYQSTLGGGGRKRSHKKIPYGLISSKKKQKKNSLKNNYQNSIIKTKKI
jgi:hypothetical protein